MWSLKIAFDGYRPRVGPCGTTAGIPLAHRKLRAKLSTKYACVEYKGDWEWHVFQWQFVTFWRAKEVCHLCRATRLANHGAPFTMFGHRWTRRSQSECVLRCMPERPCPLLLVPGWHQQLVRFCCMHVLNLGIYQGLCAEALLWMAQHGTFNAGADLDAQLREAFRAFKSWAKASHIYCSGRMFTSKRLHVSPVDYPYLGYKAHNCRIVLAFVAAACCKMYIFDLDLDLICINVKTCKLRVLCLLEICLRLPSATPLCRATSVQTYPRRMSCLMTSSQRACVLILIGSTDTLKILVDTDV